MRTTDPPQILDAVCGCLDVLVDVGSSHEGLFPSLLHLETHEMMSALPPAIHGQREGDRCHEGCNLMHDQAALKTMYALDVALDRPGYTQAADAYLHRFATHCTDTATGLFPWGEHAFWDLAGGRVGTPRRLRDPEAQEAAVHDHLRQAPLWLWEKLHSFDANCARRFGEGLDFHWVDSADDGGEEEYIRHAWIERRERMQRGARSCDFPRHGGFYIFDWAFALSMSKGEGEGLLAQIRHMLDYWWRLKDSDGGLLIESRTPEQDDRFYQVNAPGQTLSLAVSLLEAIPLLERVSPSAAVREVAADMRLRASVYIDGFLAAPHDLERGEFIILCRRDSGEVVERMPIWGSVYGVWPASYVALTALCGYRLTGGERLLRWAEAVGERYAEAEMPSEVAVPAMDAGLGLGLLADLYELTGDQRWLRSALKLSDRLLAVYFRHRHLPAGAAGIAWYESQMGPSFLLHGLARTALLAMDRDNCPLEADYTAR